MISSFTLSTNILSLFLMKKNQSNLLYEFLVKELSDHDFLISETLRRVPVYGLVCFDI